MFNYDLLDAENCYHVVTGADNALLDGFTVTKGYASGSYANGGGLYNESTKMKVKNSLFNGNYAVNGAGVYNSQGDLAVIQSTFVANTAASGGGFYDFQGITDMINCMFVGNMAANGGGLYSNDNQDGLCLTNCVFSGNTATASGGGIYNLQSDSLITNCTFSANTAGLTGYGGGIYNGSSSPDVVNSIFWGNSAGGVTADETSQIYTASGTPVITYCCVQDEVAGDTTLPFGGEDNHNIDTDPQFVDPDGADNVFGTEDDSLRLRVNSPCKDTGNNDAIPDDELDLDNDGNITEEIPYDFALNNRKFNIVVDKGAYETTAVEMESLPYVVVACSARGSIVRIDTRDGTIVGEYWSAPNGRGRNPSRTTVDLLGNVWVGNRDESSNGKGSVIKIGLIIGGTRCNSDGQSNPSGDYLKPPFEYNTCIDRNNDGLIKTSRGLGDIRSWLNTGGVDDNGGILTADDEAILLYVRVNGTNVRHVSVDRDNNVWVGGYGNKAFDLLHSVSGTIQETFNVGCGGYGGLVDRNGVLWSSSGLRYDTVHHTWQNLTTAASYGLSVDTTGFIWGTQFGGDCVRKITPDGLSYESFVTGGGGSDSGVAVTPIDNHIWIANREGAVSRLDNAGTLLKVVTVGSYPTGVAVDIDGKVWVTNMNSNNVMRINPHAGPDGLGAVDLTVNLNAGAGPYNYSDMTGVMARYVFWSKLDISTDAACQGYGNVVDPGEGSFTCAHGAKIYVVAQPELGYCFVNWTGTAVDAGKVANPTSANTTVTMDADYTLVANFEVTVQYTLSISSTNGGSTVPGEGNHLCDAGDAVSITAVEDSGYSFSGWTGTAVDAGKVANPGSANTTVTMDGDYTVVANFLIDNPVVNAGADQMIALPNNQVQLDGSVFNAPPGSTTKWIAPLENIQFNPGDEVLDPVVTFVDAGVYELALVLYNSSMQVIAYDMVLITVTMAEQRYLTISSSTGGSVVTPGEGVFPYADDSIASIEAAEDSGYTFSGWTGNAVDAGKVANPASANTTVTMDADYTLVANFVANESPVYYPDLLPYMTSFEDYQKFVASNIDGQNGWQVYSGSASVTEGASSQYLHINSSSTVGKTFDDSGSDHTYIRVRISAGSGSRILILNGTSIIGGVEFNADGNLYVLDQSAYVNSNVSWSSGYYELKFVMDYASDNYDVFWNGVSVKDNAGFGESSDMLTELKVQTDGGAASGIEKISIADESGSGAANNWAVTSPAGGYSEVLNGRVPFTGRIWWDQLGFYEIKFCPTDLNKSISSNWFLAYVGWNPVSSGGTLGYWETDSIPNGSYYLGITVYDDSGSTTGLQEVAGRIFTVSSDLKYNTFSQEEEADISVKWAGQFPFEFKRSYDSNRRLYSKPLRNGWIENNGIYLVEDTTQYWEPQQLFPQYAEMDGSYLAYGQIWVVYPDGSKQLFHHNPAGRSQYGTTVYKPAVNTNSGDYIERTSYVEFDPFAYVYVNYVLKKRDGSVMTFSGWEADHDGYGANYGWKFGKKTCKIQNQKDRFGNQLNYSWSGDVVSSITENGTTRMIEFTISNGYYTEARLKVSGNVLRKVQYLWNDVDKIFTVKRIGYGVDEDGVYDGSNLKEYLTQYQYNPAYYLMKIVYGDNINNPSIEIDYDDFGRILAQRNYVEPGKYLETNYGYTVVCPDPQNPSVSNLEIQTSTSYNQVTQVRNNQGKVTTAEGSLMPEQEFEYNSGSAPYQPTGILESSGDSENVKKTVNQYNSYGVVLDQRIYEKDGEVETLYSYIKVQYHPIYNLVINQAAYQVLNSSNPDNSSGKVETKYVYGNADGTTLSSGKYLVEKQVLVDEATSDYAVTKFKYLPSGLVTETIDLEDNDAVVYQYDAYGYKKLEKIGPSGSEVSVGRFYNDAIGQLLMEANARGGVTINKYDGFGQLYEVNTYEYAGATSIMNLSDADFANLYSNPGSMTLLSTARSGYDTRGNCTYRKMSDIGLTAGGEITTTYTLQNQPKRITYGGPTCSDCSYLEYGYTDRGLKESEYRYDSTAAGTARQDWWVVYEYDDKGRLENTYWYDYDDATVVKRESAGYYDNDKKKYDELYGVGNVMEKRTDYEYDILGRMSVSTVDQGDVSHLNLTIGYHYDGAGNLIYKVDPKGNYVFTDYDNVKRKIREYFAEPFDTDAATTKANAVVSAEKRYYDNGSVKNILRYNYDESTNPLLNHEILSYKEFEYDSRGRIKKVSEAIDNTGSDITDPYSNSYRAALTQYQYSDAGIDFGGTLYHIIITDAENKVTRRALDAFDNLTKILYPSGDYKETGYYGDGYIATETVFDSADQSKTITYDYDGYGRLLTTAYPDDSGTIGIDETGSMTYQYDGFGRKVLAADNRYSGDNIGGNSQTTYGYDVLDRIVSVIDQDSYATDYAYTADGQKKAITVTNPSSQTIYNVDYSFDLALRLDKTRELLLGANNLIADVDYDDNGNHNILTYSLDGISGGSSVTIDYDNNADNRLNGFTTTGGPTFSLGNVTVDGLGRLRHCNESMTEADQTVINYTNTCTYDMLSELKSAIVNDGTTDIFDGVYVYNKNGDMQSRTIDQGTPTSFTYLGNLMSTATGGESFALGWDGNGNMTAGVAPAFIYNWDNKLRSATNGVKSITSLKYDPDGNRIRKVSSESGDRKYIVDVVGDLPTILLEINSSNGSLAKTYIYTNSGIVAQHDGDYTANRYFYLKDRLGNVRQIINTSGTAVKSYAYSPFGETLEQSGLLSNPFMFTGQWLDTEIDQYYLRARMYDPHLARFTGRDPVLGNFEEPMTLHAYLYCLNDPINKIDPSGEFFLLDFLLTNKFTMQLRAWSAAGCTWAMTNAQNLANWVWVRAASINQTIQQAVNGLYYRVADIGTKLNYLFGQSGGVNAPRSSDMLRQLNRIGIQDTPQAREYIANLLNQSLYDASNIVNIAGGKCTREILIAGPQGFVKMQAVWEGTKLITMNLFGG